MKTWTILIFLLSFFQLSFGQFEAASNKKTAFFIAYEPSGLFIHSNNPNTVGSSSYLFLRNTVRVGLQFKDTYAVGLLAEYGDTVFGDPFESGPQYGVGVLGRYYFPFRFKKIEHLKETCRFYTELNFNYVNYYLGESEFKVTEKMNNENMRASLGVNYRIWRNFHLDLAYGIDYYFNGKISPMKRFEIEYYF